jgi:3-oxoadipate enol-lactonase
MTMDLYAADVLTLMDHLEIGDACIGGISMGGYVAFALVQQAPSRASGLVLAHTRATADAPDGRANRDRMIDLVRRDGPESIARAMLPKLLGETTRREQPDLVETVGQMIRANTPEAIAAALTALRDRPDRMGLLASIACPTLIIAGDEDALIPRADAEAMHAGIAGSRLVMLPRVGHLGNLEAPSVFNEALYGFLTD